MKTSQVSSVASAMSVESGGTTTRSGDRDPGDQPVDPLEHDPGQLQIALVSDRRHRRPGAGQRSAGLGRLHRRVEHRVAGPPGTGEELRSPYGRITVEQQRGALGCVGVLVQVDRDGADARDGERPGGDRPAEPGGVGQHPAADARVDVAADALCGRGCRDLGDRVDHPVGVRRRRGDHQDGAVVDRGRHRHGVCSEVGADGHRRPPRHRSSARPCGRRRAPSTGAPSAAARRPGRASRAPCTASSTDSVPPDVTVPTTPSGASSRSAAKPTSSFSICSRLGNAVGSRPLLPAYAATAARADLVDLGQPGVVDVGERAPAVHRHVCGLHPAQPCHQVTHRAPPGGSDEGCPRPASSRTG